MIKLIQFSIAIIILVFSLCSAIKIQNGINSTSKPRPTLGFSVYWNVPTCKCNISFLPLLDKYNITYNFNDSFRGYNITLLYDPGEFPIVKTYPNGTNETINGGIPQKGNLTVHLKKLKEDINKTTKANFSGLGIIDFEVWRPVFRQNWNAQVLYRNLSIQYVKDNTTFKGYNDTMINKTAKEQFEAAAQNFMLSTLKEFKKERPNASWGYYGYPYCYNYRNNMTPECPEIAVRENNETVWLFNESTALYPSLYLSTKINESEHIKFLIGTLNEAYRVSSMVNYTPIYPYLWFRYLENETYLTEADMRNSFIIPKQYQMGGVILWGKGIDLNTTDKCQKFYNYVNNTLGPFIKELLENSTDVNDTIIDNDYT